MKRDFSRWGVDALERAVEAAGIAMWLWNVDTDDFEMDEHGYALWGISTGQSLTFELLSAKIHPADRDRVRAAFNATRNVIGPYEIDFRTLFGDDVRWISARGRGNDEDILGRMMAGVFLDVTGRKQAEESSELLAGEMSHRVKNLLGVASALARVTSRSASDVEDMTTQLTHRLTALGRAHDLVRPLPRDQGDAALLGDIFTVLLAPYDDMGAFAGRVRIALPRMGVGAKAADALALIVHELATNSLKYGSLSSDTGVLDVSGSVLGDNVRVTWTEHGGPRVEDVDGNHGFGKEMVRRSVENALGGSINYEWPETGALVTMELNARLLSI